MNRYRYFDLPMLASLLIFRCRQNWFSDIANSTSVYCNEWGSNTPFTQGLRPVCLPCAIAKLTRSPLKAQRRRKGCRGRSRVAQRTSRSRHGRHGRREVLSMFKTVAQRSPRRPVAHRSLKGGRRKAHASPWSHKGGTGVNHWSPRKNAYCCKHCVSIWAMLLPPLYHHYAAFGRPTA